MPPIGHLSDEALIGEFQQGNEAAFNELVCRYKDQLTNFVYRFVGDFDQCQDVVQETFVRVFRNKMSYRPVAKFSTWIYTIATNLAKSHLRRRKFIRLVTLSGEGGGLDGLPELADESSRADRMAESGILEEIIQGALDTLPVKYREIILLREVQELSYEEIAGITGVNLGTVKSRINRARSKLQELLKDQVEG